MRADQGLQLLKDVLAGKAAPPASYDHDPPPPRPRQEPPRRQSTTRGVLPPYDPAAPPLPEPTADNCRCWKCWLCPCVCPPGQGLRGPVPLEMRADGAAPTEDSETVEGRAA